MFGWDDSHDAHRQVYGNPDGNFDNQAKFSHELIAGAASFEGFKLFEDKQRREGKPVSHAFAKEVLAGFVGGEVDRLAETKGMNEYQRYEAKKHATQSAQNMYDQHYQGEEHYNPHKSRRHERFDNYDNYGNY